MIIEGEALEELCKLESDSVDFVCTDPPYGYSFMNRDWDRAVPHTDIWQECLRVLKPGAFLNVMSAPRSDVLSRMIVNIESAGFRVDFTPIYWTYASGFPKAGNIGKLVDKRLGAEREVVGKRSERVYPRPNVTLGAVYSPKGGFSNPDQIGKITAPTTPQAKARLTDNQVSLV